MWSPVIVYLLTLGHTRLFAKPRPVPRECYLGRGVADLDQRAHVAGDDAVRVPRLGGTLTEGAVQVPPARASKVKSRDRSRVSSRLMGGAFGDMLERHGAVRRQSDLNVRDGVVLRVGDANHGQDHPGVAAEFYPKSRLDFLLDNGYSQLSAGDITFPAARSNFPTSGPSQFTRIAWHR